MSFAKFFMFFFIISICLFSISLFFMPFLTTYLNLSHIEIYYFGWAYLFLGFIFIGIQVLILLKIVLPPYDNAIYKEAIRTKNYDKAIEFCKRKIDFTLKKNAETWKNLAKVYLLEGEYERAIETLKTMMNIKMRDNDAFIQLINLYIFEEDYISAIELCNQRLETHPYDSNFQFVLHNLYKKFHNWHKVLDDLRDFIELIESFLSYHPNNHSIYFLLSKIYKDQGELDKALKQINTALEIKPVNRIYMKFKQDLLLQKEEKK